MERKGKICDHYRPSCIKRKPHGELRNMKHGNMIRGTGTRENAANDSVGGRSDDAMQQPPGRVSSTSHCSCRTWMSQG